MQPNCRYCGAPIVEGLRGVRAAKRVTCAAKECRRAHHNKLNAEWRAANREKHRAQIKAWRQANAERVKTTNKAWMDANRAAQYEKNRAWSAANRDRHKALVRDWEYRNRMARAGYSARREVAKADGHVEVRDWLRLVQRCGGRCFYCGCARPITVDHVIPLSRGGRHTIGNVVPACRSCNSSKQDKLLAEWRAGRCHGRGRKARETSPRSATRLPTGSRRTASSLTGT